MLLNLQVVAAKDFRQLNFGDSCEDLDDLELNQGSTKSKIDDRIYKGSFIYHGIQLQGQAIIAYDCGSDDLFRGGFVYYQFFDLDTAEKFLQITANLISDVHGSPMEINVLGVSENNFKVNMSWELQERSIVVGSDTKGSSYMVGLSFVHP